MCSTPLLAAHFVRSSDSNGQAFMSCNTKKCTLKTKAKKKKKKKLLGRLF